MRIDDLTNATLLLDVVPSVMLSIREEMRGLARGRFTVPQFRILNQLLMRPRTNRELAAWMGVSPPTMSKMIETLEAKSLIQRECDPNDGRAQTLTLTALGKRETENIRRAARERFAARIEALSDHESQALSSGLKLLLSMFAERKNMPAPERTKPRMNTRVAKSALPIALLTLALGLSSCLGDKSQDDYIRERVGQQRAKIEAIQGTYRGSLVSSETGLSLGSFALDLRADIDVQNSYDNTASQPKAVAKGTLYYSGIHASQINFESGYYDDRSQVLEVRIPVTDVAGASRIISLHGTIDGDSLTGRIDEETLGGFAGEFQLLKNGPASTLTSPNLSLGRVAEISASIQDFAGTSPEEGPNVPFRMVIQYREKTSQQLFLNVFLPERSVAVTWDYDGVPVVFTNALLDERRNSLTADTQINSGFYTHHIKLECVRIGYGTPALKWDCRSMAGTAIHHAVLSPAPAPKGGKE